MKRKLRNVLVFLLVLAIGLNTTGMSVFAEEAKVQEGWDGVTTQSVYEGDNYKEDRKWA